MLKYCSPTPERPPPQKYPLPAKPRPSNSKNSDATCPYQSPIYHSHSSYSPFHLQEAMVLAHLLSLISSRHHLHHRPFCSTSFISDSPSGLSPLTHLTNSFGTQAIHPQQHQLHPHPSQAHTRQQSVLQLISQLQHFSHFSEKSLQHSFCRSLSLTMSSGWQIHREQRKHPQKRPRSQ